MAKTGTAKVRRPRAKKAAPAAHPPYITMISTAITALKDRGGSSRQAIEKYIKANFKVTGDTSTHLKMALKRGVASGKLLHTKGTGASGSFKVNKAAATPKKPKKRPAAKKPKKRAGTPKKKKAAKKTGAKKATKKKTTTKKGKSPAKKKAAKKPKSAAKKKTKSPKKRAAPKKKVAKKPKTKAAK